MKKSPATGYSPALDMPRITRSFRNDFKDRKTTKQAEGLSKSIAPPTEEMIDLLNRIGQEYPFCVYYKQKVNDPL